MCVQLCSAIIFSKQKIGKNTIHLYFTLKRRVVNRKTGHALAGPRRAPLQPLRQVRTRTYWGKGWSKIIGEENFKIYIFCSRRRWYNACACAGGSLVREAPLPPLALASNRKLLRSLSLSRSAFPIAAPTGRALYLSWTLAPAAPYARKMLQEIQLVQGQTNYVVVASGYPSATLTKTPAEKRNVPIAPAPEKNYVTHDTPPNLQYRKKVHFRTNPYTGPQAASIARRNARERNRVKQVNDGFNALRRHLPASVVAALSGGARRGSGKKLSKVDTLRMVVEYIRYLQQLLEESDAALGITRDQENRENIPSGNTLQSMTTMDMDDGFFYGSGSPCSEKPDSPAPSECSSGVSSAYSADRYEPATQQNLGPMDEDELLDVISWWQQK